MIFAFHALVFFILGIVLYYIDTKQGIKWYRGWHNLTHKDPMPDDVIKGFLVNNDIRSKLTIGLILVIAEIGISFFWGMASPLEDIFYGIGELVGVVAGFYLAPKMIRTVPGGVKGAIEYMDKVDKGEANVKKDILRGAIKAGSEVKNIITAEEKDIVTPPPPPPHQEPEPAKPKETEEPKAEERKPDETPKKDKGKDDDWRGGIKKFMDK